MAHRENTTECSLDEEETSSERSREAKLDTNHMSQARGSLGPEKNTFPAEEWAPRHSRLEEGKSYGAEGMAPGADFYCRREAGFSNTHHASQVESGRF